MSEGNNRNGSQLRRTFNTIFLGFLIFSVCVFVSVINKQSVNGDYVVPIVDTVTDMHGKMPSTNFKCQLNNIESSKVLAKVTGEDAKKILNALEDGNCITFRVAEVNDSENSDLIIEIIKVDKNKVEQA